MKKIILFLSIVILFSTGCKETIVEQQIPKEFTNDLLHADLIGKVIQTDSKALVIISQVVPVDSVEINPADGSFAFHDLRIGNYNVTIQADNYRIYEKTNLMLTGGSITYLGEVEFSTVPDLVESFYPQDKGEVVYDWRYGRITVSILFTQPMDRESVEKAFTVDPPVEGIFYWGNYTQAPMYGMFSSSDGYERGATITTYSNILSMSYAFARKDSYSDTTYTVTIGKTARDTSHTYLRFPLQFKFKTVQSYSSQNGILTDPVHGDIGVSPLNYNYTGITVTFPRRMDKSSVENSTIVTPQMNTVFLWPEENVLRIYTGGPFLSDTTITVSIDQTAKDKDGNELGHTFSFAFRTAALSVSSTSPSNGQLFVSPSEPVLINFNNYVTLSSAQTAFSISPDVNGSISYGGYYPYEQMNQIKFTPNAYLEPNTKYTVTIQSAITDMHGKGMGQPYSFSFVSRPN
ncbi:MAG TPA: Ig-like domain-containing protein [Ignavibacteriaceae bacterium]|nr:Ig-like domain-containing protein [Ignavibacteriaceae bacterium]